MYFTSTQDDVFALINLPEIVKGTLFSRYSRTAKDVRRLFLDEFFKEKQLSSLFKKTGAPEGGLVDLEKAEDFYSVHKSKPFYNGLVEYITSGPIVGICLNGSDDIITVVRTMMGKTNPAEAEKGTIRSDYGIDIGKNTVHGSDSEESAKKEIPIVFDEKDFP